MTKIILSYCGKDILVDDEDYDYLNNFKWHVNNGYARRSDRIYMQKLITNTDKYIQVDHKNGNKFDNRKENLRVCNNTQNSCNKTKIKKFTSSKYKGVYWNKEKKKWKAKIKFNTKDIHIGYFICEHDAAKAYNEAALKYHGEFASLNHIYHMVRL